MHAGLAACMRECQPPPPPLPVHFNRLTPPPSGALQTCPTGGQPLG